MSWSLDSIAAKLALCWVYAYTSGLPREAGDRRREEVARDLCDHMQYGRATGRKTNEIAVDILRRSLMGAHADLGWRLSYGWIAWAQTVAVLSITLALGLVMSWVLLPAPETVMAFVIYPISSMLVPVLIQGVVSIPESILQTRAAIVESISGSIDESMNKTHGLGGQGVALAVLLASFAWRWLRKLVPL